jgi:hypothetical protein
MPVEISELLSKRHTVTQGWRSDQENCKARIIKTSKREVHAKVGGDIEEVINHTPDAQRE